MLPYGLTLIHRRGRGWEDWGGWAGQGPEGGGRGKVQKGWAGRGPEGGGRDHTWGRCTERRVTSGGVVHSKVHLHLDGVQ